MTVHIVKPNETIELIAKKYNLSVDEIISINPHFRSWEHLAPGAKLRIPEIPEYIQDEIDDILSEFKDEFGRWIYYNDDLDSYITTSGMRAKHMFYDVEQAIRKYAKEEFDKLYPECKRLYNPHEYHVGLSKQLLDLKKRLLLEAKQQTKENTLVLKKGK